MEQTFIHGNAKLTLDEVRDIKRRQREGESLKAIAAIHNRVTNVAIWKVLRGKTWKGVE